MIVKKPCKPIVILYCVALLFISLNLKGQNLAGNTIKGINTSSAYTEIKPLDIGDQIPEIVFDQILNHSSKTARLSDFKGKLVILDFWATWCGACVQGFAKMAELQKQFKNDLQIVLVNSKATTDTEEKIHSFIKKRNEKTGKSVDLPQIITDTVLDRLFPHSALPHYAWIDKDGVVAAITSSIEVNKENIAAILAGKPIAIREKKDLKGFVDSNKPLFITDSSTVIYFNSTISGYKGGFYGAMSKRDKGGEVIGMSIFNTSLLGLCQYAYPKQFVDSKNSGFPSNRTILEVKNSLQYKYHSDSLMYKYSYCYDITIPKGQAKLITNYLQDDLRRSFNITVSNEKKKMHCYALFASDKLRKGLSESGEPEIELASESLNKYIRNENITAAIQYLNDFLDKPLIDETNLVKKIDIELPFDLSDTKGIIESLKKIGFIIKEETRTLEVVVISDK